MTDLQSCSDCGWCCEFPNSHIEYCGGGGCKYIRDKYDVWFSEDGELEWKLKTKMKNRLDHLPYDCLQYILQFCSDDIMFNYKRNVIYSTPFQSKLKSRYLEIEYPEDREDEVMSKYEIDNERFICKFLFNDYPVSSFTIERDDYDNYEVNIEYRKLGSQKKFVYKKMKPDTEEYKEWNEEAKIYNDKRNKQKEEMKKLVVYSPYQEHRSFEIKDEDELIDEVRERIEEDDHILYLTTGIIWDNLYRKQKDMLQIGDIEALQTNEHASVLKAICDIDGVIEDVIRYDGYEDFLGLRTLDNFMEDRYLYEREH